MKAAIMHSGATLPQYAEMPEPTVNTEKEILVTVKAVSLKNFDKKRAEGKHYSAENHTTEGRIIGSDGICLLPDGTRVYGMGNNGMIAERAAIHKKRTVKVPHNLDDATAAALPNAVIGSAMGLRFKAHIQPGDVVLINGATGFTGRVAVQVAKHYGAAKVIATGRNSKALEAVRQLGADVVVAITNDEEAFKDQIKTLHAQLSINIVIDYLWGRPAEMLLESLKSNGAYAGNIRFVSIGSMAGDVVQLSSAILRSTGISVTGSGLGAWADEEIALLFTDILPEMYQLAARGELFIETVTIKAKDIARLWDIEETDGKRVVVLI